MKKCGRPNQNGEQPLWMLARVTLAVYGFDAARRAGAKYFAAIQAAVPFVRELHPTLGLLVSKADPSDYVVVPLRDGTVGKVKILWTAAIGPRPTYPR
jgi:hypothetical protein